MDFTLRLPITPRGKLAPHPIIVGKRVTVGGRKAVVGAFAKATKAPETRAYEAELVALVLAAAPAGLVPVAHYAIDVAAVLPLPKTLRVPKAEAHRRVFWAPVKPDADNVVKSAQDALTVALRHILGDDAHCVCVRVGKVRIRETDPALIVRVYSPGDPDDWLTDLLAAPCAPALGWRTLEDCDDDSDDIGGPA